MILIYSTIIGGSPFYQIMGILARGVLFAIGGGHNEACIAFPFICKPQQNKIS